MNDQRFKLFLFSTAAQCAATAIVILSTSIYWRLFKAEAWPVLVPSVIAALSVEALILLFALQAKKRSISHFLKIISATVVSWFGGLACFLVLDGVAKYLYFQTPKIAWLGALLILFFLVRRLDTTWSRS